MIGRERPLHGSDVGGRRLPRPPKQKTPSKTSDGDAWKNTIPIVLCFCRFVNGKRQEFDKKDHFSPMLGDGKGKGLRSASFTVCRIGILTDIVIRYPAYEKNERQDGIGMKRRQNIHSLLAPSAPGGGRVPSPRRGADARVRIRPLSAKQKSHPLDGFSVLRKSD